MITQQYLKEILHYNPDTGVFMWKEAKRGRNRFKPAGTYDCNGYLIIKIDYKRYRACRLAWVYMTGKEPEKLIDHINRNVADDRWSNLREATHNQNQQNKSIAKNNTSGHKGISIATDKRGSGYTYYRAQIGYKDGGTRYKTKMFSLTDVGLNEAINWLEDQRQQLHKEFAAQ